MEIQFTIKLVGSNGKPNANAAVQTALPGDTVDQQHSLGKRRASPETDESASKPADEKPETGGAGGGGGGGTVPIIVIGPIVISGGSIDDGRGGGGGDKGSVGGGGGDKGNVGGAGAGNL